MTGKRRMLIGGPIMASIVVIALWYAFAGKTEPGTPASAAQQQAFLSLIRQQERTFFVGWVTGDLSGFPAVYYNDPKYRPSGRFQDLIKANRDEIDAVLVSKHSGPAGARIGELAARMADVLSRRGSDVQWQAAVATATAEGRNPTLSDMPDGEPPAMTPQLSDWIEKQFFIKHATIQGETHASIIYVLDSPDSTLLFHLDLTNVGGQWYISKDWTTGNP